MSAGADGSRSPREGDYLCTDCGAIHTDSEDSCRNCGNDRFARVGPERTESITTAASVEYRCKECGTTAPRNTTPCKTCGNPTFESVDTSAEIPTAAGDEPDALRSEKSPEVAALLSFFVTGLGQAYAGDLKRGGLLFGALVVSLALLFVGIGLVLVPIVWGYGIYDAYTSASRPDLPPA